MKNQSLEQLPPHDKEAEQSVLGACFHSPDAYYKAVEILKPSDFYKSPHKIIFSALIEWFKTNECVDVISLAEKLKKKNKLESAGDIEYLSQLEDYVPTATAVTHHSKIVKDMSVRRAVIAMCHDTSSAAYNYELNGDELLAKVNAGVLGLESQDEDSIASYKFI